MPIAKIWCRAVHALSGIFIGTLSLLALWGAGSMLWSIANAPLDKENLFPLFFGSGLALFWIPLAWLVMYHATPKKLTERYLKEPHFSVAEIVGRSMVSPLVPFHNHDFHGCLHPASSFPVESLVMPPSDD